jgi:hypothetical protein
MDMAVPAISQFNFDVSSDDSFGVFEPSIRSLTKRPNAVPGERSGAKQEPARQKSVEADAIYEHTAQDIACQLLSDNASREAPGELHHLNKFFEEFDI